jgi:hypothetical protein
VTVVSDVLRIKRALDGAEIDKIISARRRARRWRSSIGGMMIGVSRSPPQSALRLNVITAMTHR